MMKITTAVKFDLRYLILLAALIASTCAEPDDTPVHCQLVQSDKEQPSGEGEVEIDPTFHQLLYQHRASNLRVLVFGQSETSNTAMSWARYLQPNGKVYTTNVNASELRAALPVSKGFDIVVEASSSTSSVKNFKELFMGTVLPGGFFIVENPVESAAKTFLSLVDVLNRAHLGESTTVVQDVDREVKHVSISQNGVVLTRKGISDDYDMLTQGDYGLDHADGRWGLFARRLLRMMGLPVPPAQREYFETALQLLHPSVRITRLRITMGLQFTVSGPYPGDTVTVVHREHRGSQQKLVMSMDEFVDSLRDDIRFATAVHSERIEVARPRPGETSVTVEFTPWTAHPYLLDFPFHLKLPHWTTWKGYHGYLAKPQPLGVIMGTLRDKGLTGAKEPSELDKVTSNDNLYKGGAGDLFKGRVTSAAVKDNFVVTVESPDCKRMAKIFKLHKVACVPNTEPLARALPRAEVRMVHSVLYQLHATERLDHAVGIGPEAGSLTDFKVHPAVLPLGALSVDQALVTHQVWEGKRLQLWKRDTAQTTSPYLEQVGKYLKNGLKNRTKIDLIFDSTPGTTNAQRTSSNSGPYQIASFVELFGPHVKEGGMYIVDDFEGSFAKEGKKEHKSFSLGGALAAFKMVASDLISKANHTPYFPSLANVTRHVADITFGRNHMVVTKKGIWIPTMTIDDTKGKSAELDSDLEEEDYDFQETTTGTLDLDL